MEVTAIARITDSQSPTELAQDQSPRLPPALAERVAFRLYQAATVAGRLGDRSLEPMGIDARQYGVLTALVDRSPRPQHELSSLLQVDRSTMVRLIDELEALGLVERGRDPADRRAYAIRPTRAGRSLQARAQRRQVRCDENYLAPLAPSERKLLLELLLKLELS